VRLKELDTVTDFPVAAFPYCSRSAAQIDDHSLIILEEATYSVPISEASLFADITNHAYKKLKINL
jgi:hypothetical protein